MSDTIAVMKDGCIQQIGTPKKIYDEPKNAYVADFIGESNILPATFIRDELVEFCGKPFRCVDKGFGGMVSVDVVLRPEDLRVEALEVGDEGTSSVNSMLTGTVLSTLFKGVHYEMMIDVGHAVLKAHSTVMQEEGSRVGVSVVPFNIHVMRKSE